MIELPRRKFIAGLGALFAAPAIVRATSLMPVRAFAQESPYAVYFNVNTLVSTPLTYGNSESPLVAGDIYEGDVIRMVYDGSSWRVLTIFNGVNL